MHMRQELLGMCTPIIPRAVLELREITVSHQDQVFLRTFAAILGGLVLLAVIFFFAAREIGKGEYSQEHAGGNKMAQKVVEENIRPVGQVAVGESGGGAAAGAGSISGEQIVKTTCANCHGSGILGAPKIGDKAEWEKRMKQVNGIDGLVKVANQGKGAMPPKGGGNYDEAQLKAAIEYMLKQSNVE
jgi:cytochrome c5